MYLLTLSSGPPGPSPPGPLAPAPRLLPTTVDRLGRCWLARCWLGPPRRDGDANVAWEYQCADGPE